MTIDKAAFDEEHATAYERYKEKEIMIKDLLKDHEGPFVNEENPFRSGYVSLFSLYHEDNILVRKDFIQAIEPYKKVKPNASVVMLQDNNRYVVEGTIETIRKMIEGE